MRLVVCGVLATSLTAIPAQADAPSPETTPAPLPTPSPAPSPLDPGPPVAITGSSTVEPGAEAVELSGGVGPHNLEAEFWIEYGETTAYEAWNMSNHAATPITVSSIVIPVGVVLNLATLSASTTYHYRITAQNSLGVSYGEDKSFTTPEVVIRARPPHHGPLPAPTIPAKVVTAKPAKAGSSCAHPFKQVVHRNGDSSSGDHKHINVLVSPPVGMEWNPLRATEICSASGVDTNGKHWRVTGHPRGARHYFAKGATVLTATITARLKQQG